MLLGPLLLTLGGAPLRARAEPPAAPAYATVRVLDDAGRPVASASVRLYRRPPEGAVVHSSGRSSGGTWWLAGPRTHTTEDGAARLPRPPANVSWLLRVGPPEARYVALADAAMEGWAGHDTEVVLHAAATLEGRVLGADGRPAPFADVARYAESPALGYDLARCDASGRFRITRLPPGPLTLLAESSFGSNDMRSAPLQVSAGASNVEIRLLGPAPVPPLGLRVRAVCPDGRLLEHGEAEFSATENFKRGQVDQDQSISSATYLSLGWAVCDDVDRPYWLAVRGLYDFFGDALPFGPARAGPFRGPGEGEIALPAGAIVVGAVREAGGGPVSGALVEAIALPSEGLGRGGLADDPSLRQHLLEGGARTGWDWSELDGSFRLTSLGMEDYLIHVVAPEGWLPSEPSVLARGASTLAITLQRVPSLTLTVTDAGGQPLAGLSVVVRPPEAERSGFIEVRRSTDAQGRVLLKGLDATRLYELEIAPPGKAVRPDVLGLLRRAWKPAEETIHLARGVLVRGTVHAPGGQVLPRATVSAEALPAPTDVLAPFDVVEADEQGAFVVGPFAPGSALRLAALPPESTVGGERSAPHRATLPPSRWTAVKEQGVPLDLRAVVPTTLAVRIEGWNVTWRGAQVLAQPDPGSTAHGPRKAAVGREGQTRLEALEWGVPYVLWVTPLPAGQVAFLAGVRVSQGEAVLTVRPGMTVSGRLNGPPGLTARKVWAEVGGIVVEGRLLNAAGDFEIATLPEGAFRVHASARSGSVAYAGTAPAASRVVIELKPR